MRSLETRIVALFILLLLVMQLGVFVITNVTGVRNTRDRLVEKLRVDQRVHARLLDVDRARLSQSVHRLATDASFVQAVGAHDADRIAALLQQEKLRVDAQLAMLIGPDRRIVVDAHPDSLAGSAFALAGLLAAADREHGTTAVVRLHGGLYQTSVVPLADPASRGWLLLGFAIDDDDTRMLHELVGLEVSYLSRIDGAGWTIDASTLPPTVSAALVARFDAQPFVATGEATTWTFDDDDYLTMTSPLRGFDGQTTVTVIQRSLRDYMAPFRAFEHELLTFAVLSMLVAILCSIRVARGIVRPVKSLAAFARKLASGGYAAEVRIPRDDEIGDLAEAFGQMRDGITVREQKILDLAYRDALTGLPNRTLLTDRLGQALATAERMRCPMAIVTIDIDRFKEVNDLLGHRGGDAVLIELARRLQQVFKRDADTIARMGADEFAVLMPTEGKAEALTLVQALIRNLETPFVHDGHLIDIRASIGIAVYPEHGDELATFTRNADSAMHVAKRTKSGYALYDPQSERLSVERLSLMSELRRAVAYDELVLFYQPKRDLGDTEALSLEALIRWQHPDRGLVGPDAFIPFAEQTGVISIITEWVVDHALAQCRAWRADGIDARIAINISTRDLIAPSFPTMVAAQLERHAFPATHLTLEITETALLGDPGLAMQNMERLHALGCRLSIDDFGTGYSSLAYLKRLPVHELKIDKSFVMNMATDSSDAVIVRSTIDLGHNMGLKVVAEGVETLEALAQLREMGCDVVQGYLISRPLNALALHRWAGGERLAVVKPLALTTASLG